MSIRTAVAIGLALALAPAAVSTQQKTDFSGRWVQLTPAEGAGGEQIIKQTETRLTMYHDSEGSGHSMVFNLDGTEGRSTMQSHGMDIVTVSKSAWTGGKLTITSKTTYTPDRVMDQVMVWSIDEKGQFIIDLTQTMTGRPTEKHTIVHKKL
ncbi:MAG TPA: hypothetical protein VN700_05550 [Vicinamibacterales bacterium]|nr:hypothetical protein [Vicinamibacterales bacterium]